MLKTKITVDVSDAKVSSNPMDILATYSLGSCVAVCLYDPVVIVGGMLHYQLPSSEADEDKAQKRPFMFGDTGFRILFDELISMGASKGRLQVKIAGAARMQIGQNLFDIGRRNYLAVRKNLWQKGMFIDAEDVGGTSPRNMSMDMADGTVIIKSVGKEKQL
ncbi:MAG: chemotaxis protein CheD [Planctomycetes bacterium]|nr:chemotaxis protein CheD [Planctomycetota bacterium]MCH8119412.1 chemotaxis protein CheD [Planctomycetota bacterium]